MKKMSIIVIAVVIVALAALLFTVTKTPSTQGSELPQAGGSATTEAVINENEETTGATASSEATEPSATTPETTEPAVESTEPTKDNKVDTVVKDEPATKDEDIKVEINNGDNNQETPDTPGNNDSSFVIDFDDLLNAANK